MKTKYSILLLVCLVTVASITLSAQEVVDAQITNNSAKFETIKAIAEKGDPEAQAQLGEMYGAGDGVLKNEAEAVKWQRKAAEQGDALAQYKLGIAYLAGITGETNHEKGAAWLLKAAAQDYPYAELLLANLYARGDGLPKDYVESYKWYSLYSIHSNKTSPATDKLALDMTPEQLAEAKRRTAAEAAKWYRMAAENGDEVAQRRLAAIYENGADSAEAIKWFRKAAERGYVTTQFLAIRERAEKGDSEAEWKLGQIYGGGKANQDAGPGVPTDYDASAKWYRKSAEQGNANAAWELGENCRWSNNYSEEYKWFRKAAELGDADAQWQTARCCYDGEGTESDEVEAAKWIRKSAEQGYVYAEEALGHAYLYGDSVTHSGFDPLLPEKTGHTYRDRVPKDYVEAYKWYNLGAAQYQPDIKFVNFCESLMTPEQIAEAQQLTRDFSPSEKSGSVNSASPDSPTASGSGFFITDDGYLISNFHVIKDATKIRLVTSAGMIAAKVVQVDSVNDLALLKTDGQFEPLPILPSRSAQLGSTVATIGFPNPTLQGFAPKLAKGEIASLSGAADDPRYFQISVPVQPGNSGGALVDERGNVVGIVSAKLDASVALAASGALPENVNYAVKSSFLLSFLEAVPDVDAKLKAPNTSDEKFEDVVKSAQDAAVLVLVY
jgi:TPR repeat protein